MALQDTDRFLVQRSGASYRMDASDLAVYIDANVFVSGTAPTSPVEGDMWFDNVNDILFVYESSLWINTNTVEDGAITPTKLDRAYVEIAGGQMTGDLEVGGGVGTPNLTLTDDGNIQALGLAAGARVYADNAAAKTGGLVDGDIYRKSDGTLMIVFT